MSQDKMRLFYHKTVITVSSMFLPKMSQRLIGQDKLTYDKTSSSRKRLTGLGQDQRWKIGHWCDKIKWGKNCKSALYNFF